MTCARRMLAVGVAAEVAKAHQDPHALCRALACLISGTAVALACARAGQHLSKHLRDRASLNAPQVVVEHHSDAGGINTENGPGTTWHLPYWLPPVALALVMGTVLGASEQHERQVVTASMLLAPAGALSRWLLSRRNPSSAGATR